MRRLKQAVIFLIMTAMSTCMMGCKSNYERIKDNLDNENYVKVQRELSIFNIADKDEKVKIDSAITEKINSIKDEFMNNEIDGAKAISNIQKMKDGDSLNKIVSDTCDEINEIMNSRSNYRNAEEYEKNGDIENAFTYYNSVSAKDTEHYDMASKKAEKYESYLETNAKLAVSSTNVIVLSFNKSIYPDQIQIIFKNNSDKVITSFDVGIAGYDSSGKNVKIKLNDNSYTDYILYGKAESININSGGLWGYENSWHLDRTCKLSSVKACVYDVTYSDGTKWENPIFDKWKENNVKQS